MTEFNVNLEASKLIFVCQPREPVSVLIARLTLNVAPLATVWLAGEILILVPAALTIPEGTARANITMDNTIHTINDRLKDILFTQFPAFDFHKFLSLYYSIQINISSPPSLCSNIAILEVLPCVSFRNSVYHRACQMVLIHPMDPTVISRVILFSLKSALS